MRRYFAKFNVDTTSWEVFDTLTQTAVESFRCGTNEELRHYAEYRALAHSNRLNQQAEAAAEGQHKPPDS